VWAAGFGTGGALAVCAAWPGMAAAQSLQALVEAARGYDATFRAAQAAAQSAATSTERYLLVACCVTSLGVKTCMAAS
jgi:hypothetical protein